MAIDGVGTPSRSFMEYPREKRLATGALNELYIYIRGAFLRDPLFSPRSATLRAHTYNAPRAGMLKGRLILSHNAQQRCIIRFRVQ